ncbi:ead/Ea22-like family protein [Citrobacter portucalensis]|uniref:ead/Ea22-like family protein n=1 Tax=Citrobacter portucalensis TaxID=1639133 RepID=UPI001E324222|nr:ead/Ea22-like family protein [Citrobacter portucalensis]UHD37435.1 ead/Ea22-like family protein [Citrobacter portucalensis]
MSNIDKRGLREAAEKATKGRWAVEFDDEIYSTDGVNHEQIAMVFSENEARDAAFIAAANPATVLAMLDELESAEKRIAEQSAIVTAAEKLVRCKGRYHGELNYRALAKLFGVTAPDLPPLEHENVHYADAAEMEISGLRQRIVELEARKVCVPRIFNDEFWLSFNNRIVFREETYRSAVIKSIEAAGIGVKGE